MGHCPVQESQFRTKKNQGSGFPAAWDPGLPPTEGPTLSVHGCLLLLGLLLAPNLEVGVLLAFLAVQPEQTSKTVAAAFTFWPRTLGGVAQVAPTRRFSPVSHLRRKEMGSSLWACTGERFPKEYEEGSGALRQCTKDSLHGEFWLGGSPRSHLKPLIPFCIKRDRNSSSAYRVPDTICISANGTEFSSSRDSVD